jgi:hypothetical protein
MKKRYQFTLILKGADENGLELEDALYKAGCNDAPISFRDGTVSLDFDREAESGTPGRLKSLREYLNCHPQTDYIMRFSGHNYSQHDTLRTYPLYAIAKAIGVEWFKDIES